MRIKRTFGLNSDGTYSQCYVCGAVCELQEHHTAPRSLFGDNADLWPKVMVCSLCHKEWHVKMGLNGAEKWSEERKPINRYMDDISRQKARQFELL